MDLLLDYATDQNNGLSTIANISNLPGRMWGTPAVIATRLAVPMIAETNEVVIFSYLYNASAGAWTFHQIVYTGILGSTTQPRLAITATALSLLDNDTRQCHVYRLDGDQQWTAAQVLAVPYTPREANTAQSGAPAAIQLALAASVVDGYYIGWSVIITGGAGTLGESRVINSYTGAVRSADVTPPWTVAPDGTTTYELQLNALSKRISAYDERIAISDWAYLLGVGNYGRTHIYQYDGATYTIEATIDSPVVGADAKFGAAVALRDVFLFVGAYDKTNAPFTGNGSVYVYEYGGGIWPAAPTQEVVSPAAANNTFFGYSLDAYLNGPSTALVVGAPGFNIATGRAYFFTNVPGWTLVNAVDAVPPGIFGDEFGKAVAVWDVQAAVSSNENLLQGAVYYYGFVMPNWVFVERHDAVGTTGYGEAIAMTADYAVVTCSVGNALLAHWTGAVWADSTLIQLLTTKIRTNVAHSIYHSTDGNTTISMLLNTSIAGNYRITLALDNNLRTVGGNNNAVYFYENGAYIKATIASGTYTEAQLATAVGAAMSTAGTYVYTIVFHVAPLNRFSAAATGDFCFGSNSAASYLDSMQDKVLGFFNNNNTPLSRYVLADREANLAAPSSIGVKISNCYPILPVRNNNPFGEVGLLATLDAGKYKITTADNQVIRIPKAISVLTFTFPAIDGGGLHDVNTNDLTLRLVKV